METVLIFGLLTLFAGLVANRASNLGRNPWTWGITAWLISPLLVWITLEICGKKKEKPADQPLEDIVEQPALQLQEAQGMLDESN